jgi:hypothetical protein
MKTPLNANTNALVQTTQLVRTFAAPALHNHII